MKLGIIGLGVGYSLLCAYSQAGHDVVGVDIDPRVRESPRMDLETRRFRDLHRDVIDENSLLTGSYEELSDRDACLICVPSQDLGRERLTIDNVKSCLELLAEHAPRALKIVHTTLPYGASDSLRPLTSNLYAYVPLMIEQGRYISTYVNPRFLVVGAYRQEDSGHALDILGAVMPTNEAIVLPPAETEMSKILANLYISTKIALTNEVASFCEHERLDGNSILQVLSHDPRIGTSFTRAGLPFGGHCFPVDTREVAQLFTDKLKWKSIASNVVESQERRYADVYGAISALNPKSVGILGVTYKAGIQDARMSPSVKLSQRLRDAGLRVVLYDPNLPAYSGLDSVLGCDVLVFATGEPSFKEMEPSTLGGKTVFDYANIFEQPVGKSFFRAGRGWMKK